MKHPEILSNPLAQDFTLIPLLRFAFPTIATMLFMGLYTVTDTIFISRLVNTTALSAVNIILDYLFMAVLGMGVIGAALGTGSDM